MLHETRSLLCAIGMAVLVMAAHGCAGTHFRPAGNPPLAPVGFDPVKAADQEYWSGIVFNGDKIGFSHFRLAPAPDAPGLFDITSEAVFSLKFLMMEKRFSLKAYDRVNADLTISTFSYDYDMDGSTLHITGKMQGDELHTQVDASGEITRQSLRSLGPVHPSSVLYLYPAVKGLQVGRSFEYLVYDGETRGISGARQEVLAFEESDLFAGNGFKVKTVLHGQEVTAWLDEAGRPLLEMALGGVMISGIEGEAGAKAFLARSSVNKSEALLDFSLIRTGVRLERPRQVEYLEVALTGIEADTRIPSDGRQRCTWEDGRFICRIDAAGHVLEPGGCGEEVSNPHLRSTIAVPAANGRIRELASSLVRGRVRPEDRISAILAWMQEHIEREPVDVFSALDVLDKGRAECQGHAMLYAALARAAGLPTRVVNGIVYSGDHGGFLYHTWVETCVEGTWISIDPTFSQVRADATHIKIVEGEGPDDLMPLVGLIGRVQAEIISFR
jgi:hypothetical protein